MAQSKFTNLVDQFNKQVVPTLKEKEYGCFRQAKKARDFYEYYDAKGFYMLTTVYSLNEETGVVEKNALNKLKVYVVEFKKKGEINNL